MQTIYELIIKSLRGKLEGLKPLFPLEYEEILECQSLGGGHYEALVISNGWFYRISSEHYNMKEEVSDYQLFDLLRRYRSKILATVKPEIKEFLELILELEDMASTINSTYYKLSANVSSK